MKPRPVIAGILITAVIAAVVWVTVWGTRTGSGPESTSEPASRSAPGQAAPAGAAPDGRAPGETASHGDALIERLYASELSGVQVRGAGRVVRVLSDDVDGDRHQRFILELDNGITLLVAHNIDDFPRLDGLAVGDAVAFHGEYEWGEQGGTIHWTHRDRYGDHPDGWLEWQGRRYW